MELLTLEGVELDRVELLMLVVELDWVEVFVAVELDGVEVFTLEGEELDRVELFTLEGVEPD